MWKVMLGNKEFGVIETNFAWASKYWAGRPRISERSFWLKEVK